MLVRMIVVAGLAMVTPAIGQEGTDPRALEACKKESASFVQVADCLPHAHVAFKIIDAFDALYPPEAAPIKAKCAERNAEVRSFAICISNAVETAVSLSASLPAGTSLDDPVFNAAKNAKLFEGLETAEKAARADFPDITYWGMGTYHPYE